MQEAALRGEVWFEGEFKPFAWSQGRHFEPPFHPFCQYHSTGECTNPRGCDDPKKPFVSYTIDGNTVCELVNAYSVNLPHFPERFLVTIFAQEHPDMAALPSPSLRTSKFVVQRAPGELPYRSIRKKDGFPKTFAFYRVCPERICSLWRSYTEWELTSPPPTSSPSPPTPERRGDSDYSPVPFQRHPES